MGAPGRMIYRYGVDHWFRAQGERLYGKLLGDIFALRDFVNVANIQTLAQYVKKDWRESRDKLL